MKKVLFAIFSCVLLAHNLLAECTVCVIDTTCTIDPAYPTSCPYDALPDATAQEAYESTITFYIPIDFEASNINVELMQADLVSVSGMPLGIEMTGYNYLGEEATTFYPQDNPPASERLCAKFCGTPVIPGNYTIQITALVKVDAGFPVGEVTQAESFSYDLTVLPNASGNNAFTLSSDIACGELDVDFAPLLASNGSPLIEYNWDFGNNQTSTSENPSTVTYDEPGEYEVSLTQYTYKYRLTEVSVADNGQENWCGFGDQESFCGSSSPDFYFKINGDNVSFQSQDQNNNFTPVWEDVNLIIDDSDNSILFQVLENDPNNDDNMGTVSLIVSEGTFTLNVPEGPDPNVFATLTFDKVITDTLYDVDTIVVLEVPTPAAPMASANAVCIGDSIMLSVDQGYEIYVWSVDSNVIVGADSSAYVTYESGSYSVLVQDENGCLGSSEATVVEVIEYPEEPSILLSTSQNTLTITNVEVGVTYQWYMDGTILIGETGTSYTYEAAASYHVGATNSLGCMTTSISIPTPEPSEPAGIKDIASGITNFELFPNPVSEGVLNVSFLAQTSSNKTIVIRDVIGKTVLIESISSNLGEQLVQLDVSSLKSGVYSINLVSENRSLNIGETFIVK